ncbi:MAG TPA: Hsp20/alpha crystallin family protein [Pirellulales bacterium]|nr:Hsp20/alpha crystallin family protein [Pirellulales bacterium]
MVRRRNGILFPIQQFRTDLERLYSDFSSPPDLAWGAPLAMARAFPPFNVWEEGDNLLVEAELPAVKSEDLDVSVVGDELTIKGERRPVNESGLTFHRRERPSGRFTRVLRLPVEVDADKVNAALNNGVLLITLPKSEAAKPRHIQVKATK